MKKTEPEKILQADPELDAELVQMAEEVPPMPADFHDRWMNAIRAEAQQTAAAPEEKAGRKTASLVRWTRMLSVAAVFVFLCRCFFVLLQRLLCTLYKTGKNTHLHLANNLV